MTWVSTIAPELLTGPCQDIGCSEVGLLFRLPSGHRFCIDCTSAFISWTLDGGLLDRPDLYDWLDRIPAGGDQ